MAQQTIAELTIRLGEVRTAISKVMLGNQSYTYAGRSYTRGNVSELRKIEKDLEADLARASDATGSGILVLSVTNPCRIEGEAP